MNNLISQSEILKEYIGNNEEPEKVIFDIDTGETKVFRNIATVDAREFRTIVTDIEAVLKKSTVGMAVAFRVKDSVLELRTLNKAFYIGGTRAINNCDDCEVVTIFKPIQKMIPDKGTIDVILNTAGVNIVTEISEINIAKNIATVLDVNVKNYGFVKLNQNRILQSLKSILSTTSIINRLGTGVNINFINNYVNCKYATVYIECPCDTVENSITHELGRILLTFLNSNDDCFIAQGVNNQIFKKGNRYLALPVTQVNCTPVHDLLETAEFKANCNTPGLYEAIKESVQAFGLGVGTVDFYESGAKLSREIDGCRFQLTKGICDKYITSIEVNLEFLRDILNISGETYKLYTRGDKVCLVTIDGCMLII